MSYAHTANEKQTALRSLVERCCHAAQLAEARNPEALPLIADLRLRMSHNEPDAWEAVYGCIITGVPGGVHLENLFLDFFAHPAFARRIPDLCRLTRQGNVLALSICAGAIATAAVSEREKITVAMRRAIAEVKNVAIIVEGSERHLRAGNLPAAELFLERRCVIAALNAPGRAEHLDSLLSLAEVYQRQNKFDDAREARRVLAALWEDCGRLTKRETADRFLAMARNCLAIDDTSTNNREPTGRATRHTSHARATLGAGPSTVGVDQLLIDAELYARKGLMVRQSQENALTVEVVECLNLLIEVAQRQKRTADVESLYRKIARLEGATEHLDEIDRALNSYVNLPEMVDLALRPDGITLHTSDFPKLILESTGLDLRKFFIDAFKDADFLTLAERNKLACDLYHCFETVTSFISDADGARMERSEVTVVDLPAAMSQSFVQVMTVEKTVSFRLRSTLPDDATLESVGGITFEVGGKLIGLKNLHLKAAGPKCIVTPVLAQQGQVKSKSKALLSTLRTAGKDLIVGALMKMGKVSIELPIVLEEYRQCLSDAVNFKVLLHEKEKDLVMFIERSAGILVADPLTRSLLTRGMRVIKNGHDIKLEREDRSLCDLGGLALEIAPKIHLQMMRSSSELQIEHLSGIGLEVPFDPPAELQSIGLDLKRALPRKIVSLSLGSRDEEDRRRLVVCTGPGCWIALDLNIEMQPATDNGGNWIILGVTNNPISGAPQKFFLRLDSANNLSMTPREIAEVVTQTAIEGFDPSDPFTWKWGAVALGGQALLAADDVIRGVTGDSGEVKKTARKIGRFIGKLLNDI